MKRGQGTFEYVLLLGGVLLIVVLAIVVLQNTAQDAFKGAGQQQCAARLLTDLSCKTSTGANNPCGVVSEANYAGCTFGPNTFVTTGPAGSACDGQAAAAGTRFCGDAPIQ
ncbi:MAG: class III signal peptide-containing protein [Candidatus Micrarchaeota archaeon]|nr:class III signal peptide-containing protein [Candidatus Micrarchaeota archaeon]